ncbi:phosphoglycolate phosphatase [Salinisphaera sp.]|uniref:phosphoglycolate phosphatase n=1 Tax=Salinisphaera sp. TaxID=1914330 RepID=UPI002D783304|nr:phosphoglycolate phosphatase [Salinisphaera sp.]HET7315531.1 phosphoglycolate phosphatase [Salinisphaera sp.]
MPDDAQTPWPRAVIFDLDGTLIDSAPDIARAVNRALIDYRIDIDAATARRFLGDGARKLVERVLAAHGIALDETTVERLTERFSACYRDEPCRDSVVFEGAAAALCALQARGVRLAVCTNKPRAIAERVIAALDLEPYLDVVIGAGQYALKPDPAPLFAALNALVCGAEEAVYVGDMAVDRQAGHAAGLPVLLAEFGYAAEPAAGLGADGVLEDWHKITDAIAALRVIGCFRD